VVFILEGKSVVRGAEHKKDFLRTCDAAQRKAHMPAGEGSSDLLILVTAYIRQRVFRLLCTNASSLFSQVCRSYNFIQTEKALSGVNALVLESRRSFECSDIARRKAEGDCQASRSELFASRRRLPRRVRRPHLR